MQIEKLFQVLVVGGALLGGQTVLRAVTDTQAEVTPPDTKPVFCTNPEVCTTDAAGNPVVKEGFECCWGTSCAPKPTP